MFLLPTQIYCIRFFMRAFGSPSMKPSMVLTNNKLFWGLNCVVKKSMRKGATTTTKRYKDSSGKGRFCGTSRLKRSQSLDYKTSKFFYPNNTNRKPLFMTGLFLTSGSTKFIGALARNHFLLLWFFVGDKTGGKLCFGIRRWVLMNSPKK